ncbi:hypothetical protein [Streptomyces sp. NBC_01198]|jgi:antitoxin YefM|uniref:hypothetical protein n=1 Tax=Streptomyces sp. NBC_01198 TaxID=2903769 RepID=UPI003FA38459
MGGFHDAEVPTVEGGHAVHAETLGDSNDRGVDSAEGEVRVLEDRLPHTVRIWSWLRCACGGVDTETGVDEVATTSSCSSWTTGAQPRRRRWRSPYEATLEDIGHVPPDVRHLSIGIVTPEPTGSAAVEDYESLKETAYLLRSPANARRLLASIDELETGGGTVRKLATDE